MPPDPNLNRRRDMDRMFPPSSGGHELVTPGAAAWSVGSIREDREVLTISRLTPRRRSLGGASYHRARERASRRHYAATTPGHTRRPCHGGVSVTGGGMTAEVKVQCVEPFSHEGAGEGDGLGLRPITALSKQSNVTCLDLQRTGPGPAVKIYSARRGTAGGFRGRT